MNISQIKRRKMLCFLKTIKDEKTEDDNWIRAVNEIENEINSKKFGLIWEEHEEAVDVKMKTHIPVFTEITEREIKSDDNCSNYNFILEGDNLHSLRLLEKTHKGRIDVIYIDPPYNTSNSLTYDDKRIDENDSFRHSKWLSFMDKRLRIAQKLLRDDGILFVSIDDNEGYDLKLLLDEIFTERNNMGVFSVIKAEGGGMAKQIVKGHDLLFVYTNNIDKVHPLAKEKDIRGKRITINNVEYWIQEDAIREQFGSYGNLYYEEILEKRGQEFKDKIDEGIKNNEYILVPKENGKTIIGKLRRIDEDYSKFYSVIKHLNADGIETLRTMGLEDRFSYPKPVSLIKELVKGATFFPTKHTPIILDFFAGSGTTGQAVLELNQEDNRDRRFILCTNNEVSAKAKLKFVQTKGYLKDYVPTINTTDNAIENKIYKELGSQENFEHLVSQNLKDYLEFGICRGVTYPRIKNIVSGYTSKIPFEKELYKVKLTKNNYQKGLEFKEKIDEIIEKKEFDDYNIKLSNNDLVLTGSTKEKFKYHGIPTNLKYFITDFVDRSSEDLSDDLLNHIREMIELENACKVDNISIVLLLSDDDADALENHWKTMKDKLRLLYISRNVLFSTSQKNLFKDIEQRIIPDHYFDFELKEEGISW